MRNIFFYKTFYYLIFLLKLYLAYYNFLHVLNLFGLVTFGLDHGLYHCYIIAYIKFIYIMSSFSWKTKSYFF